MNQWNYLASKRNDRKKDLKLLKSLSMKTKMIWASTSTS